MSQKPLSEIYHKPGNMSEEVDYTLTEMKQAFDIIEQKLEEVVKINDILQIQEINDANYSNKNETDNALSLINDKIEKLTLAIQALADKLDSEDVTNLDNNYRSTVDDEIN
jgi:hypothetical protein